MGGAAFKVFDDTLPILLLVVFDADGRPLPGFTLADCKETIGNEIAKNVVWKGGEGVSSLAGKPIRLRFVMKDADLYSLKFEP